MSSRAQDPLDVALFLELGAELDQGRPAHSKAEVAGNDWGARPRVLLIVDNLLDKSGAASAEFLRPGDSGPSRRVELGLPHPPLLEYVARGGDALVHRVVNAQLRIEIVREPLPQLHAKRFLFRRKRKIHCYPALQYVLCGGKNAGSFSPRANYPLGSFSVRSPIMLR